MLKVAFAGTTNFGIPVLETLKSRFEIALLITQPDRPVGRKQNFAQNPIKSWSVKHNFPVVQPNKIIEASDKLAALNLDILLVAAYGQIIPQSILDIPHLASLNIHGSILPKYRGATPIQNAIINGDKETGITLIKMDALMDHGPIIGTASIPIENEDNITSLSEKLARLAAQNVPDWIEEYSLGNIQPIEQDHERATFTKLLNLSNAKINWTDDSAAILRKIRALNPEPGTWTTLDEKSIKILEAHLLIDPSIGLPGKLKKIPQGLAVKCSKDSIILTRVHPAGGKIISGMDFANGIKNLETKIFI